jgi:hypothetical protein
MSIFSHLSSSKNRTFQSINDMAVSLLFQVFILEKVRPLEKEMRYQLDKLLALSASSSDFAAAANNSPTIVESAGDVDGG